MAKLTITITASTQGIITDENGKTWNVTTSFHARRIDGEYKYHELYVYLNKLDDFKDEFKAPKTLKQKWFYNEETKKLRSIGKDGVRVAGYTETFERSSSRASFDINELEYE